MFLAERRNVANLESLENTAVHRSMRNESTKQENGIAERSVNDRPRDRHVILNTGHLPGVVNMAPGLRELVAHQQRGALAHPRVDSQLDSAPGNRVDKLGNRSTSANSANLRLVNVQQVVKSATLVEHVIREPHQVTAIGDNLRRISLENPG